MTPTRITLSRAKGWRKPDGAIVVSRPSIWGNPFAIKDARESGYEYAAKMAMQAFDDWLHGDNWACGSDIYADRRTLILSRLPELRGHDLCCWCKPGEPCHGDILIRMANG